MQTLESFLFWSLHTWVCVLFHQDTDDSHLQHDYRVIHLNSFIL